MRRCLGGFCRARKRGRSLGEGDLVIDGVPGGAVLVEGGGLYMQRGALGGRRVEGGLYTTALLVRLAATADTKV